MNLIIIPFHDWRKSQKEGFRTRDVHFINALNQNPSVDNILVINRPTTQLELLYKGNDKAIQGKLILKYKKFTLTEVKDNLYVIDYLSNDFLGQLFLKHLWFINKYNNKSYTDFIEMCNQILSIKTTNLIVQNIFAYKLAMVLKAKVKVFDAWDNFLKFPAYRSIKSNLTHGYEILARETNLWITNSKENILFFKSAFKPHQISLVKNGVKLNFLPKETLYPKDLALIKKPIIGFGGKVSHLMDYELINFLTKDNKNLSFVFVGQILDREIFDKIEKRENVFFLGDKKYSDYPNYVANFDVCIVPYNVKEKQHGGDSIKAYEYLLTGKKVVGTVGNGLQDLEDYIYLTATNKAFSKELKDQQNNKSLINGSDFSWKTRCGYLLDLIKNEEVNS